MAVNFNKEKLMSALEIIHNELNKKVIDTAVEANSIYNSMDDENPQREEFKVSIRSYQDTYNSLMDDVNKMLTNFDNTLELEGALSKYTTGNLQFRESDATIDEIDTSQIFA